MSRLTLRVGFFLIATVMIVAAVACQAPEPAAAAPDYAAELGPATEAFIGIWNSKDYDALDAIMSPDCQRHAPDQNADGRDAMKEFMTGVHTAYPDFHIVIDEAHYMENLAAMVWTVTGTNTGDGAFPATGKSVAVQGMTMLRFAGGMISEEVVFYDTATMTNQLGLDAVPHTTQ